MVIPAAGRAGIIPSARAPKRSNLSYFNKSNIRAHSIDTYLFGARELVFSIYPWFAWSPICWVYNFFSGRRGPKILGENFYFVFFLYFCDKRNTKSPGEVNFSEKKKFFLATLKTLYLYDAILHKKEWFCVLGLSVRRSAEDLWRIRLFRGSQRGTCSLFCLFLATYLSSKCKYL